MDDAAPRSGVTEVTASYGEALRLIGTQDPNGNHIGIVHVSSQGLRLIALGLRTLGLLVVVSLIVLRQPFGWLPIGDGMRERIRIENYAAHAETIEVELFVAPDMPHGFLFFPCALTNRFAAATEGATGMSYASLGLRGRLLPTGAAVPA